MSIHRILFNEMFVYFNNLGSVLENQIVSNRNCWFIVTLDLHSCGSLDLNSSSILSIQSTSQISLIIDLKLCTASGHHVSFTLPNKIPSNRGAIAWSILSVGDTPSSICFTVDFYCKGPCFIYSSPVPGDHLKYFRILYTASKCSGPS